MARSFNGTTDIITAAHSAGLNPNAATGFTISVWVNPIVVGAINSFLAVYNQEAPGGAGSNYFLGLSGSTPNSFGYFFNNSAKGINAGTNTAITANNWYNVVATFTTGAAGLAAFVNGVADGTSAGTSGALSWGTDVTSFGAISSSGSKSNFLNARIADWAIWSAILSATEIAALAKGVRPGRIRPSALGAWLPLDGLQSSEPDLSGNVNNGTLTGTASTFGPPILPITSRWPQSLAATVASTIVQRRTLDNLGTRVGSRQMRAA